MGAKSLNVYIESITLKAIRPVNEKNIQFTDSLCDVPKSEEKRERQSQKLRQRAHFSPAKLLQIIKFSALSQISYEYVLPH